MKRLLVSVFLLFTATISFANKIDELNTDSDVVHFLISLNKKFITGKYVHKLVINPIDSVLKDSNCFECDKLSKTWKTKSWQKVDLNNDGRTDLVVTCYWYGYDNYVVIDKGDGTFKLIRLCYNTNFTEPTNVIHLRGHNYIVFHSIYTDMLYKFKNPRTDTLIYKFEHLVELNKHPPKYDIDSIIVFNGSIWPNGECGSCPKFKTTISKYGKISFDRYVYGGTTVKTAEGYYKVNDFKISTEPFKKGQLLHDELKEIFDLINYINFKNLKDRYDVPWTDDSTSTIQIKFKDGSSKTIVDYGEQGTFGLRALFTKLYAFEKANNVLN